MEKGESHLTKARFARRHLYKVAGVGLAAIVARLAVPKARAGGFHDWHDFGGPGKHHCFLEGTRVRTITGERAVQDLVVGDLLPTHFNRVRPIQWIGRYHFTRSDASTPWARDVLPVRVARSALAPNVPHTDLYLTQAHAIFTDGVLVRVGSLVNGATIALHHADDLLELEYYHIKLQSHDVIYAEGAPCETLLEAEGSAANLKEMQIDEAAGEMAHRRIPILSFTGSRSKMQSHLRSAVSPLVDRREKIDIIRDRLEERALTMA